MSANIHPLLSASPFLLLGFFTGLYHHDRTKKAWKANVWAASTAVLVWITFFYVYDWIQTGVVFALPSFRPLIFGAPVAAGTAFVTGLVRRRRRSKEPEVPPRHPRTRNPADVIDTEYSRISAGRLRNAEADRVSTQQPDNLVGLALSGGGVRSATFNLGLLQALARSKVFDKIDYLSTVSGGGYIGSSLTWLLDRSEDCDFPFGTTRKDNEDKERAGEIVRWIRRHGEYLIPGDGINKWALSAAVLRGTITNLLFLLPLFFLTVFILGYPVEEGNLPVWTHILIQALDRLVLAVESTLNFAVDRFVVAGFKSEWLTHSQRSAFLYCFATGLLMLLFLTPLYFLLGLVSGFRSLQRFRLRRLLQRVSGNYLMIAVSLVVVGTVPFAKLVLDALDPPKDGWLPSMLTGTNVLFSASLAAIVSVGVGWFARRKREETRGVVQASLVFGLVLFAYALALWLSNGSASLLEQWKTDPIYARSVFAVCLLEPLCILVLANLNQVSMHKFYHDRLLEAYMPSIVSDTVNPSRYPGHEDANTFWLHSVSETQRPYHIVNANLVARDSRIPKLRARGGENFIFSPMYCGSQSTEYVGSKEYQEGRISLATAMAISGAAIHPHTGVTRSRALSSFMTFFNVRLGYWIRNPFFPRDTFAEVGRANLLDRQYNRRERKKHNESRLADAHIFDPIVVGMALLEHLRRRMLKELSPNYLVLLRELLGLEMHERNLWIHLSDGGHFENLGLYELIRRKCKLIIVSDASADRDVKLSDLARACELVRLDFGAKIEINAQPLRPKTKGGFSDSPFVIGKITYVDDTSGILVFVKTVMVSGLPEDINGYERKHEEFPDQTTADQFFREEQFEAYRELGYQIGRMLFREYEEQLTSSATPTQYDPKEAKALVDYLEGLYREQEARARQKREPDRGHGAPRSQKPGEGGPSSTS